MKNLKITLTVLLALILSISALAQDKKSGFRAGYVMSSITEGPGNLNGFYAGFSHDRPIAKSNILFAHGGTEYTQAGYMFDNDNFRRLHYISLPTALKIKLGPVFVQGGYALNFKVAETYIWDGVDVKTSANKYRVFNFPLLAGAGLMVGPVTVEARFNYGLSKLNKVLSPGDRLSYLQIGAALHF